MNALSTMQTSSQGKFVKTPSGKFSSRIKMHVRRVALEVLNLLFNYDFVFLLVGIVNKKLGLIKSVFLVYPATEDYALAYVYPQRLKSVEWTPWPAGILLQNGKLTLMFVISAHNGSFIDPKNSQSLQSVVNRMERIRQLVGAERKTFAGTLPGILFHKRILRSAPEAELTAEAVVQAIRQVRAIKHFDEKVPIIVLGGRGFIGRRVVKLLEGSLVYSVDIAEGRGREDWPFIEGPSIVVNITQNNALRNYLDLLRPGTVVLNEVYPEPDEEITSQLRKLGCSCFHIVGVKAIAIPRFPGAYESGIPCCAAWPAAKMRVIVSRLI